MTADASTSLRANGSRECAPPTSASARVVMTGSAKQSSFLASTFAAPKLDCFVASAPLRKRFAFVAGNDAAKFRFSLSYSERMCVRILAARCARALRRFHPQETRGRRESRVRAAPAVSRAIIIGKNAHEHTGSAEAVRPSLRNGFTAYNALSSVSRALLPPSLRRSLRQAWRQRRAPERHVFAVRSSHARQSQLSRPPHPTARS